MACASPLLRRLPAITPAAARASSSLASIRSDLTARRLPSVYDYLSPTPSHLLKLSLAGFIPSIPAGPATHDANHRLPYLGLNAGRLPAGHHLVYFPPQVTAAQLLPDGMDVLHDPGDPFRRRMWAGGSVQFYDHGGPVLIGQRAVCVEGVRDVTGKGTGDEEKVFVRIERRVAEVGEGEQDEEVRKRVWRDNEDDRGDALVIEHRNLVFMMKNKNNPYDERESAPESQSARRPRRIKTSASKSPDFQHTLIPTRSLLFRFSALTFSSHFIHFDRSFARDVDGYRDLLVHGPLTLALMLSVFQAYNVGDDAPEAPATMVDRIDYRNLAPLFVDQPLTVCGKKKGKGRAAGTWDIWIENEYGLAVKADIRTGTPGQLGGFVGQPAGRMYD